MEAFLLTNVSSRRGVGNASSSHSTRRCRRSGGTWCRRHRPRQKVRPRWISTFSVRFVSHGRFRRKTHAVHWWLFYLATHATPSAEQDWILIGAGDKERSALCIMLHDAAARIGDHGRAMADAKEHFLGLRLGTTYTVEVYCPTEAVDLWHNYSIAWHSEGYKCDYIYQLLYMLLPCCLFLMMVMASPDDGRGRRGCKATSAGPKLSLLLPADGGASLGSRWGWRGSVPGSKKAKVFIDGDDGMVTSFSKTESQFSLSSMSLDMPGMDDYLQLQHDFIVCTVCAKHACATHPRSIAERERRTRISKRLLRRLQQLVTNMDKQKNTSDMLHIAVDYIKVSPTLRMSTPPSTPPASSGPLVSSRATSDQRAS